MQRKTNEIRLQKLLQRGFHLEKASEFEHSIFEEVFRNAAYAVEKIVGDNRSRTKERYRKDRFKETEILNVVSFIGRRGTGKSSALISFQKALEAYDGQKSYGRKENIGFSKETDMENVRFFTLEHIDASVLEASEDVFILVLAGMYQYLKSEEFDECSDEAYRNLLSRLGEIYGDFLNLKEEKPYENDIYSKMERLAHIASSQNIRMQFTRLVESYLSYLGKSGDISCREGYLVITIDDLDMAQYNEKGRMFQKFHTKSYEIINSIHKYLTIPGVIVLTAYNHVNLMQQNWNFFMEHDSPDWGKQEMDEQKNESAKLAAQFIDKVFSLDYRIYMPSWRKSDLARKRFRINVRTNQSVQENLFYRYSHLKNDESCLTVREFILVLYAAKIGIYFNYLEDGQHFLMPDSIRKLVNIVKLFECNGCSLEQAERENGEYRKYIFLRIKEDAYFRFVQENLYYPAEKSFFDTLLAVPIERRGERLVREFCAEYTRLGKGKKKLEKLLGKSDKITEIFDNRNVAYSFAELIHIVYHLKHDGGEEDRQLAACILYLYSIGLSELYDDYRAEIRSIPGKKIIEEYRFGRSRKKKCFPVLNDKYASLKRVIGKSICGHWTEYYFPEVLPVLGQGRQEPLILGAADAGNIAFRVQSVRVVRNVVRQFIACALLYADVLEWENVKLDILRSDKAYSITFQVPGSHELEMTAYMNYAFLYRDFLWKLENLFLCAIESEMGWEKAEADDDDTSKTKVQAVHMLNQLKKAVREEFKELWDQFVLWDQYYGAMMIPIHNFDLTCSLLESMYVETSDRDYVCKIVSGADFWDAFDGMNEIFGRHLHEVDLFYGRENEQRNFYNIFMRCPFLGLFRTVRDDETMSKNFGIYTRNIIAGIMERQQYEESADEYAGAGMQW